jgi:hypothetical protein
MAGLIVVMAQVNCAHAGLADWLDALKGVTRDNTAGDDGIAALTQSEIVDGLKQALDKGVQHAVTQLGQPGGFLEDARVRIPMPEQLQWTEKALRSLGQDQMADEFVGSMNRAAEKAVPEVASLFGNAIREMTVEDAKRLLSGPDDAATRYFRDHTSDALLERMRPIVSQATDSAGVTALYKSMMSKVGGLSGLLAGDALDLDSYVTHRAMDGLFLMIADEEKKIRENPLERSTELLQKVFADKDR